MVTYVHHITRQTFGECYELPGQNRYFVFLHPEAVLASSKEHRALPEQFVPCSR